jgi:exosortase J
MAENLPLPTLSPTALGPQAELITERRTVLAMACTISALAAIGCLGIFRELAMLWTVWTTDPLRSIGVLVVIVGVALTVRAWRQCGWPLSGTWWGLVVIGLSYTLSLLRQRMMVLAVFGEGSASLIPLSLPVFVYGSGVVLLFAGREVWRRAWFPLGLLLLSQPVPILETGVIDIPLQSISAHVARSFATAIHFAPSTPQLQLMFSPDFGMFIAPGCDGIRGAITMGYVALILGYLKRVVWYVWAGYVAAAVLLGYLFNFIRLCALVLYYRVALGHPTMEDVAKQADYAIGSCLFLIATMLFVWLARGKGKSAESPTLVPTDPARSLGLRGIAFRCAAFGGALVLVLSLPSSTFKSVRASAFDSAAFAARMPKQVGNFRLARTWYEQQGGVPVVQAGAYSAPGFDEVTLAIYITSLEQFHDPNSCWLARGLAPEVLGVQPFVVVGGTSIDLNTGFYNDGVTDSIVVNAVCSPQTCAQYQGATSDRRFGLVFLEQHVSALAEPGRHPVSIMVRIDRMHSSDAKALTREKLLTEAREFISGIDPMSLSRAFQ